MAEPELRDDVAAAIETLVKANAIPSSSPMPSGTVGSIVGVTFHELADAVLAVAGDASTLTNRIRALEANGNELLGKFEAATAELTRLRAGEAHDPGPEYAMPTSAQWIRRWNDATAERRLEVITNVLGELDRATRCFEMNHDGRLAEADQVARQLADAPTRWAYNQACKALWRQRRRAEVAEAANVRVRTIVRALVDDVRANTDEPGELINAQLLLDAVATALTLPADGLTPTPPTAPDLTDGDVKFLADLVGGTGNFVWGELASHHGMDSRDVERIYRKLAGHTAPTVAEAVDAPREGCIDHMPTPNPDCEACTS